MYTHKQEWSHLNHENDFKHFIILVNIMGTSYIADVYQYQE